MKEHLTFSKLAIGVLEIKYPGLKTKELKKNLRAFLKVYLNSYIEDDDESLDEEFTKEDCIKALMGDLIRDVRFVPDAFRILEEENEIQLFEVEDTHPLKIEKLKLLAKTWLEFSEVGISFRLFVTDRYGASIRELDLDLYERLIWG